ncbi:MAG: NAD(P)-dependent alcohol dehydrogenase, partial [Nitrospirota bacterium]|nr:NAD(P)-dependent alcohol dehydrogenase [Nitrospirota bacterium]
MGTITGYAALQAGAALEPFTFERRPVGSNDVRIQISYCGVCHSDIHQA